MDELARAKKKYVAVKRAEFRLRQRLDAIDWEYDVLLPEVERLSLTAVERGEIPQFVVEDED